MTSEIPLPVVEVAGLFPHKSHLSQGSFAFLQKCITEKTACDSIYYMEITIEGGEDAQDALSLYVIFRKRAL